MSEAMKRLRAQLLDKANAGPGTARTALLLIDQIEAARAALASERVAREKAERERDEWKADAEKARSYLELANKNTERRGNERDAAVQRATEAERRADEWRERLAGYCELFRTVGEQGQDESAEQCLRNWVRRAENAEGRLSTLTATLRGAMGALEKAKVPHGYDCALIAEAMGRCNCVAHNAAIDAALSSCTATLAKEQL